MSSRFPYDKTYLLCFTGYRERKARVERELARVGIDDAEILWSFPTPYDAWEMKHINHIDFFDRHPGCWNVSKNHYRAIKTAYELGMKSLLIIEDDVRFFIEQERIDKAIADIPKDWDVLMFDHFKLRGNVNRINDSWVSCEASASTACYAMTRKAMERFIDMYESPVTKKYANPIMRNCDHWTDVKYLGRDIKFYCASPNVCIQQTTDGESNCGRLHCESKYDRFLQNWRKEYAEW